MPKALLHQIKKVSPPTAEVVALDYRYDDEDYNIAVFVDKGTHQKRLQDLLFDLIFDYDDAHGTSTVCHVWPKSQRQSIARDPADPKVAMRGSVQE